MIGSCEPGGGRNARLAGNALPRFIARGAALLTRGQGTPQKLGRSNLPSINAKRRTATNVKRNSQREPAKVPGTRCDGKAAWQAFDRAGGRMYARKLAVLAIGALGLAVAALAGDPWREGWSYSAGEYQARCASCHGVSGMGDGPMAQQLQLNMPDLTTYARRNGGIFPTQLAWMKIDGRPASLHEETSMPCWGWELRREATMSVPHPAADPELYVSAEISALVDHLKGMQVE